MDSVATTLLYLQAESLLIVFTSLGFLRTWASLSLIPLGIGCLLGFLPRFYDKWLLTKRRKQGEVLLPEDKLFEFALATPMLAIALWWFAWTIPPEIYTHWIVPMLSLILTGFALNDIMFTLQGYLADNYTIYTFSALTGGLLAQCLLIAGVLPFTHNMYTNINANVATLILATVATIFCVSPYILLKHGKAIWKASPFAQYSWNAYIDNQVKDDMNAGVVLQES